MSMTEYPIDAFGKPLNIHTMNLFEKRVLLIAEQLTILIRVPGGWLYQDRVGGRITSQFIPYNNEFQVAGEL